MPLYATTIIPLLPLALLIHHHKPLIKMFLVSLSSPGKPFVSLKSTIISYYVNKMFFLGPRASTQIKDGA